MQTSVDTSPLVMFQQLMSGSLGATGYRRTWLWRWHAATCISVRSGKKLIEGPYIWILGAWSFNFATVDLLIKYAASDLF